MEAVWKDISLSRFLPEKSAESPEGHFSYGVFIMSCYLDR